jgi:Putative adhesin
MPRALLPVAVLLAVVLCAVSGFALAGLAFGHTEEHSRTVSGPVTRVVVDGAVGDVALMAASVRDVTIHERRRYGWRKPRLQVDLRGGVLHVRAHCGSWSGGCADDLDIVVPHSVRTAAVASGSGDVALAGLTGDAFTATTDSGDVRAHRISGSLTLRSDSGDLETGDIAGLVRAHTDSGDVRVRGS